MTEIINFSGDFGSLSEVDRDLVTEIFRNFYGKVERMINNEISFEVFFKDYKKLGNRKKFSVGFKVVAPGDIFEVSVADWDLRRVVRKACEKMETEIDGRIRKR